MQARDPVYDTYCRGMPIVQRGIEAELVALQASEPSFPFGTTWLHTYWLSHAITCNAVESVRWMIAQGIELNYMEEDGYSPLKTVAEHAPPNDMRIARLLLQAGASAIYCPTQNPNNSAIHHAASMNRADVLEVFLEYGGNLNWVLEDLGGYYTPLDCADGAGIRREVAYDFIRARGGLTSEELGY